LSRWLSTILEDTLTLNTRIPDNYGWDHGHTHSKVSGSPALIRLDVAALTDPRTTEPHHSLEGTEFYDPLPPKDIPGVICEHASRLAEEHNLASPTDTMNDAVQVLTNQWERLVTSDWIDEFYTDLATIRQLLNRAHNRKPPLPRGRCFTCNTQLWQEDGNGQDTVTCPKCQRSYDHLGLVKLKLQHDRERA
jgi:hypothetical protein